MKKLLALILSVVMVVSLAGCLDIEEATTESGKVAHQGETILDTDQVKVVVKDVYTVDGINLVYFKLEAQNKSNKEFTVMLNKCSVNDYNVECGSGMPMTIEAGKKKVNAFSLFTQDTDVKSVEDIENITFNIELNYDLVKAFYTSKPISLDF